ncbi:MAG: tRNA pseudouridine(38-40) synthase TruA [Bacteroidales bacterium]|nr:tRNA pseudouridine(38-40) synthase TruA [Bacteroidales bacterium]
MRYFMRLAFNGTPFFGWQMQPKNVSVQGTIENALSLLLQVRDEQGQCERIAITGCGRTDTGVHARDYTAHFDCPFELEEDRRRQLVNKLNSFLPKEIVIFDIFPVADTAHARFDAIDRTYRYYVNIKKDAFTFPYAYRIFEKLDVEKMNEAAQLLLQNEDFTSFSKVHTQVNNMRCKVTRAQWLQKDGQLVFEITANRFLRNMVRAIVGTLLQVGKGRLSVNDFQQIILKKNRCEAGDSAPAHALFLENVRYE